MKICRDLRFIDKDGRKILQARWGEYAGETGNWEDVPYVPGQDPVNQREAENQA